MVSLFPDRQRQTLLAGSERRQAPGGRFFHRDAANPLAGEWRSGVILRLHPEFKGADTKGLRFQKAGEMTKSRGIGRGGARPGSGRKKGSEVTAPRMRAEILGRLEETDQKLPLYELLDRVRDETLDPKYRDLLRIQILPYMHPRLRSDLTAKPFFLMSQEEIEKVEQAQLEHEKQVARGRGHLRVISKGSR